MVKQLLIELRVSFKPEIKIGNKLSARDFLGMVSVEDATLMDAAIEAGCDQVDSDDWE